MLSFPCMVLAPPNLRKGEEITHGFSREWLDFDDASPQLAKHRAAERSGEEGS